MHVLPDITARQAARIKGVRYPQARQHTQSRIDRALWSAILAFSVFAVAVHMGWIDSPSFLAGVIR